MSINNDETFYVGVLTIDNSTVLSDTKDDLIGRVEIDQISYYYFKEDDGTNPSFDNYHYMICEIMFPTGSHHLIYDSTNRNNLQTSPVHDDFINQTLLFIINIIPIPKAENFILNSTDTISALVLKGFAFDFKREDGIKACGLDQRGLKGECRACLKYYNGLKNKVLCTIDNNTPDTFYIPTVGKTESNDRSLIVYFKTPSRNRLWEWLDFAVAAYAGIAVNGGANYSRPNSRSIGETSDWDNFQPNPRCGIVITPI